MPNHPKVVMLHSARASHAHDEDAERAAIEDRLGFDILMARTAPESVALLEDAEIALCNGITDELVAAAAQLQWVQAFSSGVDAYPLDRFRDEDIVLTNAAGIHAVPISEQVLGYMLMFSRRLTRGVRQQYENRWERYEGGELKDETLGLVGVGAVGSRVAAIAQTLEMRVLGVKRDTETVPDGVDEVFSPDQLFEVLPEADYLVIACPLTDATDGLIGGDELDALKNSAVLINISRGAIVDYDRLVTALQLHEIRGAGLDVFPEEPYDLDSPLWDLPNVVVTPHNAGSTPRKPGRIAEIVAQNYAAFIDGDRSAMPTRVV